MKCSKCKCDNIIDANYCMKCGDKFSLEEKKKAKRRTFVGKLELLEEAKAWCTLEKITGHIAFKIAALLVVIAVGVFSFMSYGSSIDILDSEHYKIQYNKNDDEYYLLVDGDKTNLNLYVPNTINSLVIKEFNENNEELSSINYDSFSDVVLTINNSDEYYMLVTQNNGREENMKIRVFRAGN